MRIYKNTSKRYDEIFAYNYGKMLRSTYVDLDSNDRISVRFSFLFVFGLYAGWIECGRDCAIAPSFEMFPETEQDKRDLKEKSKCLQLTFAYTSMNTVCLAKLTCSRTLRIYTSIAWNTRALHFTRLSHRITR